MSSRRHFLSWAAGGIFADCLPNLVPFAGQERPSPKPAQGWDSMRSVSLKWDVFVAPRVPVVTNDLAPGEKERPWPPISSTLIYGSRDAVVVDSFITQEQARAQANWIASTGKNLTTIYATHGHGDHFFGSSILLERFPGARFVATPAAIQIMKEQVSPEYVAKFWESRFPNQLPKRLVVAEELRTNVLELEGESLVVVPLRFTDTAGTTCLHVPSLELIAAGDAAYNGVHLRLVESNQNQKRDEWLSALDQMESFKPRTVVAGHKNMKNDDDGPRVLGQTRQYILDFQEIAARTATAKELYDQMLSRYPEWLNRGALWSSATALKK
jgi:glyoxylase-like metal-dependent hydrolase (beta-lactamase superfamily II)